MTSGLAVLQCVAMVLVGCAPARPQSAVVGAPDADPRPVSRTITIGTTSAIAAMSIAGDSAPAGGWNHLMELVANGLITADAAQPKPAGRLAERVPSVDDGTIQVLPDGRMKVVYPLRRDITWHDGVAFSAQDMLFSYQLYTDRGLPAMDRRFQSAIESVEAPDDYTFVLYLKAPAYWADSLQLKHFWPHPQHLLQGAYERYQQTNDAAAFLALPYWTSDFIHTGPFKLTRLDPGEGLNLEAYDRYFLGRPRVTTIRIRMLGSDEALFTNLLAGAVDIFPQSSLDVNLGSQLKSQWDASGQGTVHLLPNGLWNLIPQHRPDFQGERANLDPQVRAALYHAIDREPLADRMLAGHPELAASAVWPPGTPYYDAVKDGLRQFTYDPQRALALLRSAGWTLGTDGMLRNAADGRPYRTEVWSVYGEEIAIVADNWRRIGLTVDERPLRGVEARDREFRSRYPGWEATSGDPLSRLKAPVASPANNWSGSRSGYQDPRAERIVDAFSRSITPAEQFQAMKEIGDFMAAELPYLTLYYDFDRFGMRRGIKAFEDVGGNGGPGDLARNSHLWDVEQR